MAGVLAAAARDLQHLARNGKALPQHVKNGRSVPLRRGRMLLLPVLRVRTFAHLRGGGLCFFDLPLDAARLERQFRILGLGQEGIKTAAMLDGA